MPILLTKEEKIDQLDLEPIIFQLITPEHGEEKAEMTLAEADELSVLYRQFLKLIAWYPCLGIVPSRKLDKIWHAHFGDIEKYEADCFYVFGYMVYHFPYFGMRGAEDEIALQQAFDETRRLFRLHFGVELLGEASKCIKTCRGHCFGEADAANCKELCKAHCMGSAPFDTARPRPLRIA